MWRLLNAAWVMAVTHANVCASPLAWEFLRSQEKFPQAYPSASLCSPTVPSVSSFGHGAAALSEKGPPISLECFIP